MSDETLEGLASYLRSQPEDFVIDWYVDGMDPDKPWDVSWVDVMFEDRLAWCIVSGFYEGDENEDICWPPDLVAHMLVDPAEKDPYVGCVTTPRHGPVDDETLEEIRWARSKVSDQAYWLGAPAWTAKEINRAIEDWCLREVGRPIQARWAKHGPSPEMLRVVEMVDAMKSGLEPKYLISPGENEGGEGYSVYASEQVMEMLMQSMTEPDE
jgi:hypothetical protein